MGKAPSLSEQLENHERGREDLELAREVEAAANARWEVRIAALEAERDTLRVDLAQEKETRRHMLDAVLAEVHRLREALTTTRREALEEAAQIADDTALEEWNCYHPQAHELVEVVAARIRALATPAPAAEDREPYDAGFAIRRGTDMIQAERDAALATPVQKDGTHEQAVDTPNNRRN